MQWAAVDKMPLLEIIRHEGTSDEACAVAVDLGIRQGKTVIVVGDVPGFYVNRCLGPYMAEVFALLTEGVEIEKMNKTMTAFGFPVGRLCKIISKMIPSPREYGQCPGVPQPPRHPQHDPIALRSH